MYPKRIAEIQQQVVLSLDALESQLHYQRKFRISEPQTLGRFKHETV